MKNQYLLIELSEPPRVWLSSELPENSFWLNKVQFFDSGSGDFCGFYDYLRDSRKRVLGVRFCPFEELGFDRSEIKVFFSDERDFVEQYSDDQSFCDNSLFKSRQGALLLTFRAPDENLIENARVRRVVMNRVLTEAV